MPLFLVTALLYAAVGFGGGSTYNALLVLTETDYRLLPSIALACNLIVVSGGVWRYGRSGHLRLSPLIPFLAASVPAAWLGGRILISETVFIGLLGLCLLISGLRILSFSPPLSMQASSDSARIAWITGLGLGGSIGFIAGLVGIGGGIFLAPVLYLIRWGTERQIAAACSLFILANSLAGLTGQLSKLENLSLLGAALDYWPLLMAVLIGGQIGSWLGATYLPVSWVRRLTGLLILYVALRLLFRLFQLTNA